MKQILSTVALCALLVPAAEARTRNVSINTDGDEVVTSCDQIRVRFDNGAGYRAEESLPVANVRSLKVSAARNGGVYVSGSNGYSVRACKAAAVESTLSSLRTGVSGNQVTADGPDEENWVVFFIVTVPRGGTIDVDSHNGPITLRSVDGTVAARAINGPIAARDTSGTLDLHTTNGPISLNGGSGTAKLEAQNGPVSVTIDGATWNGSLDARTENGPLAVKLPRNFVSGTLIEAHRGPVSCNADLCRDMRRGVSDDDEPRRIEFGSGPTVIHKSTNNGPVSVKED